VSDDANATVKSAPRPAGISDGFAYRGSPQLSEVIVLLSIVTQFAYNLASLKLLQTTAEVTLLAVLLYAITTVLFGRWETALLILFVAMTGVSVAINPLPVVVTDAKQFGLATLTLVYFSRVRFRSALILPAAAMSVILIVLARIAPGVVAPFVSLAKDPDFNESRFGGLFLNAHFNAYFLAVAFIYYGYRVRLRGIGTAAIFLTASKFVLVSYLASISARFKVFQIISRFRLLLLALVVLAGAAIVRNQDAIKLFLNAGVLNSAAVILEQALDERFHQMLLNPFPGDYLAIVSDVKLSYNALSISNEIALFAMCIQGGTALALLYLTVLMRRTKFFRVFIAVSLFHYGFVLSPLIVYMLVAYSHEISVLQARAATAKAPVAKRPLAVAAPAYA
jgi:hypothetical protein